MTNPLHDLIKLGGKKEVLEALQSLPADQLDDLLNDPSEDNDQETALHKAVKAGWHDVIPAMIRAGADPAIKNFFEEDALFLAVTKRDIKTATALLESGASAKSHKFEDQKTALQLAIENKNLAMTEMLLRYGADVTAQTPPKKGMNAFHFAAKSTPEIMDLLLRQENADAVHALALDGSKNVSVLRIALGAGDRNLVEKLLDYGVNVNETDDNGETPLFYLLANRSSREEALPLVKLLIERGADVDKAVNYWDETPLFPAVRESFTQAVGMMLDLGLDANHKNHFGQAPLHLAAEKWDAAVVCDLIAHGADVNALNKQKRTPLHVAAHANRLDVVKALLEAGADPFLKDDKGKTPRDLAPASFQHSVNREIDRKEQEIEIKKYGYSAYWNKKAKEPDPAPRGTRRFQQQKHSSRRFGGRR